MLTSRSGKNELQSGPPLTPVTSLPQEPVLVLGTWDQVIVEPPAVLSFPVSLKQDPPSRVCPVSAFFPT